MFCITFCIKRCRKYWSQNTLFTCLQSMATYSSMGPSNLNEEVRWTPQFRTFLFNKAFQSTNSRFFLLFFTVDLNHNSKRKRASSGNDPPPPPMKGPYDVPVFSEKAVFGGCLPLEDFPERGCLSAFSDESPEPYEKLRNWGMIYTIRTLPNLPSKASREIKKTIKREKKKNII